MSAETLRRAASLMRERADAATPGPWGPRDPRTPFQLVAPTANICGIHDGGQTYESCIANAEHIASWHPAVAVAVADWLDSLHRRLVPDIEWERAVAVANAYVGEEES